MLICGCGGIGSFLTERFLRKKQRRKKGAAVKIFRRPKPLKILGTARVTHAAAGFLLVLFICFFNLICLFAGVAELAAF